MPEGGAGSVPAWLADVAAVALFVLMFDIGLRVAPRDVAVLWQRRALLARGLAGVLIVVPVLAVGVVRAFELPRAAAAGIVLMAIAPGAPVGLRRSVDAGAQASFAPLLQALLAALAVVAVPAWIELLDWLYTGSAAADMAAIARQVALAQLVPLALGMSTRAWAVRAAARVEPWLARSVGVALAGLTVAIVSLVWRPVIAAGPGVALAVAAITVLALVAGHRLGGTDPRARTAVAIACASRNAGLALLIASANRAAPATAGAIFAYVVVSSCLVLAYATWRRRTAGTLAARRMGASHL